MKAPIVIFAYNRVDKLKACVESLSSCDGADEAEVYIYADGAKGEQDREAVEQVHKYIDGLKTAHGFRQLNITQKSVNTGLAENVISGVTEVINRYGKVIVLEDDLTVTKDYLDYMNKALDFYEEDSMIWSVTGFTEPIGSFKGYDHDIYYAYRACSYGWGTWKDRWETVDWEMGRYDEVMSDRVLRKKFERGGHDMTRILKDQKAGLVNSWAIRWCLSQSLQNKYTVYPVKSFVLNTGNDGSGTNDMKYTRAGTNLHTYGETIQLEHLHPDKKVSIDFYRYHSSFSKRLLRNLNPAGIRKQFRRIRKGCILPGKTC